MTTTIDPAEQIDRCRRYGQRHANLKPETFTDVIDDNPAFTTEEMRAAAWASYRSARAGRGGIVQDTITARRD